MTTPPPALSTMWAMQPRFERDLHAFFVRAGELGYGGVEVNHSMDAEQVAACFEASARTGIPVTSIHAPAPLERVEARGRSLENRALNLASLDEAERTLAVEHHVRSIEVAAAHEVRHVVVHLGQMPRVLTSDRWLREHWKRREAPSATERWDERVEWTHRERAEAVGPYFEAARRSLAALAERAADLGVTIGLECRLYLHEFPTPEEAAELLRDHSPEVAGYWHDAGHAEVLHRLDLVPLESWFTLLGDRLTGAHLHDVDGLRDHRAPGIPDGLDFAWLASRLPPTALRTFEIDQHEPDEAVARAVEVVGFPVI